MLTRKKTLNKLSKLKSITICLIRFIRASFCVRMFKPALSHVLGRFNYPYAMVISQPFLFIPQLLVRG